MAYGRKAYNLLQKISALTMMLALLWLSVSIPFVFNNQQQTIELNQLVNLDSGFPVSEEESDLLNGTNEEKTGNSSSFSEEYQHENHAADYISLLASWFHKIHDAGVYIAFHGETLVPPPNIA